MELLIEERIFTLGDFKIVLLALAFFIIFPIAFYLFKKDFGKAPKSELKMLKIFLIIVAISLICVLFIAINDVLFYMVEKRIDNIETKIVTIETVTGSNRGCEIIDDNDTMYRFFENNKEMWETLETNFLDSNCEIEFYKISKYVKRIKVIE